MRSPGAPAAADDGDVQGRGEADGELVVAGGEAAVVFLDVDAALDGLPVLLPLGVERGWPPAARAAAGAVLGVVGGGRDRRLDPRELRQPRFAREEYDLSARTRSVRVRVGGRPGPGRATRMPSSTVMI
jgi:hypothetical protein